MKIGVSSYSFWQYLSRGEMSVFDTVIKAKEMGFEAIEFAGVPETEGKTKKETAQELRELAEKVGIEISAYVVGANFLNGTQDDREKELAKLKEEIDIAQILGVKLFRHDVFGSLPLNMCFDEALMITAPLVREATEYAHNLGIKTMIENHGLVLQDPDRVEKVVSAVNHKNFALLVDIGNFMCADLDNVFAVSRVANLAVHVHMKDFRKIDFYSDESKENCFKTRACNYLRGTATGYGDAKSAQCLQILKQAGYDGYVDVEFEGPEDCMAELEKSLKFIRSVL